MAKSAAAPLAADAVTFFRTPADLRRWFGTNHSTAKFLWVGFLKKETGRPSITWQESVDEALCVGWIDGIRKRRDEASYTIRFTPRRPGSIWSAINMGRVAVLKKEGRMRPAGLQAFSRKRENKSGIYSYEQRPSTLPEPYRRAFASHKRAADFFETQPPSYRKLVTWWVVSAKKEETRQSRLAKLVAACTDGKRL
jgi:uncharacterized protein YdeI (YjbR/CyaY-like superfamily)